MTHLIKNLVLFKLGWLACVMLAADGQPLLATAAVAVVATIHLVGVPVAVKEALLLMAAALIGLAWESLMVATGLLSYPGYGTNGVMAPYWIVAMWVLFATTINHGLRWVKRDWGVAALAGLVGGPLAFFGGAKLGAVEFSHTLTALAVIGAGWAVLLPVLAWIADSIIDSPFLEPPLERRAGNPPMVNPIPIFERNMRGDA
jgi:hypothetical protein